MSDNVPIGEFTEMHWTGLGKCLLAYLPQQRREQIIDESELPRSTANTITDPDELRRELKQIREQGYAIEDEERREGIRGVEVPILTPDDEILGSIGLTGPVNRFDATQITEYITLLEEKATVVKLRTVYY
ncbi:IclR family transcriptional regulator [Saliphagus sp. GCM10025308]